MRITPHVQAVLQALLDGPRYGYEIMRKTGISDGTVYPMLARLVEEGMIVVTTGEPAEPGRPPRRHYELTTLGRETASR